jgi:hypothetical protein
MAFGAILGLAGSAIGAIGSMGAARSAATASMYDAQQRRLTERETLGLARQQMGIGQDLLNREFGMIDRYNDIYGRNAALELNQRDYGRAMTADFQRTQQAERLAELDRLGLLDSRAATEYERRRTEIANNRSITAAERARALQELDRAQQIAMQERQFQLGNFSQDRLTAQQERDFAIAQMERSRATAADERSFNVGELRRNQNIRSTERETALRALEREQQLAQSERNTDAQQLAQAQATRQQERSFQIDEYRRSREQAMSERDYDIGQRAMQQQAIDRMSQALESAYSSLPELQQTRTLGEGDIAAEAARREQVTADDFNRIIDRTASVNEADLIRRGIDRATPANDSRAAIASQLAPQLAQLREQARSEAIRYVAGVNEQLKLPAELEQARRQAILRDVQAAYGARVDGMRTLGNVRSANDGPQFDSVGSAMYDRALASAVGVRGPLDVGSGVYTQDIGSANNFSAPISIGSGILDRNITSANSYQTPLTVGSAAYGSAESDLGYGLFNSTGPQRSSQVQPYGGSGAYNYSMPSMSSGASVMSGASGLFNNVLTSRGNAADASDRRAGQAAAGAGAAITNFATQAGSLFGGWLDDRKAKADAAFNSWSGV